MIISVRVYSQNGWRTEQALVDSGAEENCMVQSLAVDCEWPSLPDYPPMSLRAANGEIIYAYGVYNLKLSCNDSSSS
jgi:hypothetical protein